jgi:beta-lactamase superfamily II metal-dependent hydrolase
MVSYVKQFHARLHDKKEKGNLVTGLLWGDPVEILEENGEYVRCRARTMEGWMKKEDLGDEGLLEIYITDVGQGDSVLIRTPDDKWHLIDAGNSNESKSTGKGAANFLRWKFQDELRINTVSLANVILSHPDSDHYGGLLNVFSGDLGDGRTFPISVDNFYHSGIGKFKGAPRLGTTVKGKTGPFPQGNHGVSQSGTFLTGLLEGKDSFEQPSREFEGEFARYAQLVVSTPQNVRRLSHKDAYLPGYGPGENNVTIRVLAPVMETTGSGAEGLRDYGSDSQTVNGNSIVLRIDYGNARLLMSGDLNAASEKLLMSYHDESEFAADVLKACHHGSDDVDYNFLRAVKARATAISSGDNESYSHPRPLVMGAIGRFGRDSKSDRGITYPPLMYSTELARSVTLGHASGVQVRKQEGTGNHFEKVKVEDTQVTAVPWRGKFRTLKEAFLSTDLTYGLVNIRTDGRYILCATRLESGKDFDYRVFQAGVDV